MNVLGNIEKRIQRQAIQVLEEIKRGERRPIKHKASGYLCAKVGFRYRLIKRHSSWELMTHEKYNRFTNGPRN